MRRTAPILLAGLPLSLALITGCPAEAPPLHVPAVTAPPRAAAPAAPAAPHSAYLLGDPDTLPPGSTVALDGGGLGSVIDGARVTIRGEEFHVAGEVAASPILGVDRVPAWLGGGVLFRTTNAVYASATFDGALRPVAVLDEGVKRVSFGPKGALVRLDDGQRRYLDLASGKSLPIAPVGLADVLMLDDGRAAALLEGGRVVVSTDRGERWSDVTFKLGVTATALVSRPGEIWIEAFPGRSFRVEAGGVVLERVLAPGPIPARARPRDPAWRAKEAPLVAAVRRGVKLDDGTVIVAAAGDVSRVDLRTGAVTSVSRGRLPTDFSCEPLRHGDEVLAVCTSISDMSRPSIVVSNLLSESPTIERSFPTRDLFYAGEDGSLAVGVACDGTRSPLGLCVREAPGVWRDHGLDPAPKPGADAGPSAPADVDANAPDLRAFARWVLDTGGRPFALIGGKRPGTLDPATGTFVAWKPSLNEKVPPADLRLEFHRSGRYDPSLFDRRWSMRGGVLRGWLLTEQLVTISASGDMERSTFIVSKASMAGPFGFAIDAQKRALQSIDYGATWVEVAPPPLLFQEGRDFPQPSCSAIGCQIGAVLRLGWDATPPPLAPAPIAPPPVALPLRAPRSPLPELACVAAGDELMTVLPQTNVSPADFGLGLSRLPFPKPTPPRDPNAGTFGGGGNEISYECYGLTRALVHPTLRLSTPEPGRVPRAVVHGWPAQFIPAIDTDEHKARFDVLGPSPNFKANVFHKELAFLEPFDPAGAIHRGGYGMSELAVALRSFTEPLGEVFAPSGPIIDHIALVVPRDPAGATGLVFSMRTEQAQVLGSFHGGSSPRLKIAGALTDAAGLLVSAVELAGGDIAALSIAYDGATEVFLLGRAGLSLLRRLPAAGVASRPANPDALAVNEKGILAFLRTPSGAEPPSAADPALVLPLDGGPIVALAPWSTLTTADDPACRGDSSGYRAIVQPMATWLQVRGATRARSSARSRSLGNGIQKRIDDPSSAPLLARVRWGVTRVCLEAVEAIDGSRTVHEDWLRREHMEMETAVVARFTGASPVAGRLGVLRGAELHQPLSCKLNP